METVSKSSQNLIDALRDGRKAIIGRGGTIATDAGYKDFPDAIYHIPADNAITTMTLDGYYCDVPENSTDYAYLASFGGITYRTEGYLDENGEWVEEPCLENTAPYATYCEASYYDEETEDYIERSDSIGYPEEILALPNYGDGIDYTYYNKVDLIKNKYIMMIDTFTFDGSEWIGANGWHAAVAEGANNTYFRVKIGEYGAYVNDRVVCNRYEYTNITSGTTSVGVDVISSTAGANKGCFVSIRPENVKEIASVADFANSLKENPITVKVARKVPIEMDLPVKMNSLLRVWNGGYVESSPWDREPYPVEVIFQTRTE